MFLLVCFLSLFYPTQPSPSYELKLVVNQVPSSKGDVFVGLYRKQDEWPTFGKQFKGKVIDAVKGETVCVFSGLPQGDYALAVYHDENKNGVLDKNLVGMPTEVYGFSNNARRTFSAPTFDEARFSLTKNTKLSINLK